MSRTIEHDYYARRLEQERTRAERATVDQVAQVHRTLADAYARLIEQSASAG